MNKKVFASTVIVLALVLVALTAAFAADKPVDATVSAAPTMYVQTPADLAYAGITAGDVAEGDVQAMGTSLQYTGVILNGDGINPDGAHPFLKVQQQNSSGSFEYAACYLGNNGSAGSFGLGFFALTQPFNTAHMRATRVGTIVTIDFTNVNGGTLPNQSYVCEGAPAPVGDHIGTLGYANIAKIDNFGDGAVVLDTFSYVGPLGGTGNWFDAAPGMNADGSRASGGTLALSFWVGQVCPPPGTNVTLNPNLVLSVSTGNTPKFWLVRFYLATGSFANVVTTGLPGCFANTFNTNYIPANPPVTAICSFVYDPALPGVVAQKCVPVP
ncbi:MAG: hypothetical protein KC418_18400 [Anaerolineales bacterium]|nr:hypothetical protein [Anaerolineales bacterium]MCB8952669.1 hypothetical protein [Ardenticatenales bacterium]